MPGNQGKGSTYGKIQHTITHHQTSYYLILNAGNYLEKMEWSQMPASGVVPSARSRHTATVIGRKMYVYGGGDETMVYDDLHVLNFGIIPRA